MNGRLAVLRYALGTLLGVSALIGTAQAFAASDAQFTREAARDLSFEIKAGQIAQHNASSALVKLLGYRIATDHQEEVGPLHQIALDENLKWPSMSSKDQAELRRLSQLHGRAFDTAYVNLMIKDHEGDIPEYLDEVKDGRDPAAQQFASRALKVLQTHLSLAQQAKSQLGH
ncbi:MAG: DUF4142 domain-containing protein [Betaproteobacteria bacterium]|nr:DUF4142 domain-containing protein [Betaproteobacteria bacterium]